MIRTLIVWSSVLLIGAAIVAGLFVVGSPGAARAERRDEARTQDLLAIARELWSIIEDEARELPDELDGVQQEPPRALRLADPWTNQAYGYELVSPESFRLCASFETEGPHSLSRNARSAPVLSLIDPRHLAQDIAGTGHQCFEIGVPKAV